MTAPLVWSDNGTVMSDRAVRIVGPTAGSTKERVQLHASLGILAPAPADGDLWQREAERDAATPMRGQAGRAFLRNRGLLRNRMATPREARAILDLLVATRRQLAYERAEHDTTTLNTKEP